MKTTELQKHRGHATKRSTIRSCNVWLISTLFTLSATYPTSSQIVVENLHDTDGSGSIGDAAGEWALDIGEIANVSENGSKVVGFLHDGNLKRPFIWSADSGPLNLADTDGDGDVGNTANAWGVGAGTAEDISADGNAVAGYAYDAGGVKRAFYWDAQKGMLNIADGDGSGTVGDAAGEWAEGNVQSIFLSSDGRVAGGKVKDGDGIDHLFHWTPETRVINISEGSAWATESGDLATISADGSIFAGFVYEGSTTRAFRWSQATGIINLADGDGSGTVGNAA